MGIGHRIGKQDLVTIRRYRVFKGISLFTLRFQVGGEPNQNIWGQQGFLHLLDGPKPAVLADGWQNFGCHPAFKLFRRLKFAGQNEAVKPRHVGDGSGLHPTVR